MLVLLLCPRKNAIDKWGGLVQGMMKRTAGVRWCKFLQVKGMVDTALAEEEAEKEAAEAAQAAAAGATDAEVVDSGTCLCMYVCLYVC